MRDYELSRDEIFDLFDFVLGQVEGENEMFLLGAKTVINNLKKEILTREIKKLEGKRHGLRQSFS